MRKLVIIGASGHGKVVADIAEKNEYKNIVFWMIASWLNVLDFQSLEGALMPGYIKKLQNL